MGLFVGDSEPSKIFVGDTSISKVFLGDTQVRPSGWQPGANTIAYWKLDGTTYDAGPNHITLSGTPTFQTSGSLTYGVFNDSIVQGTLTTSTPITVNSWLNLTNWDSSWMWFFAIGNTTYSRAYFGLNNNRYITIMQNGTNKVSSTRCPQNTRFNIVYTTDGTTTYIYLNGTLIYTVAAGHSISGTQVYVGCRMEPSRFQAEGWKGYMSEAILENKVRTAQEISDYYNQTKANYGL